MGTSKPVIVLGDLNDEPDAATSQLLLGPSGSQLPLGDDNEVPRPIPGNLGISRSDKGDGRRLFNLTNLIAADQRFSRVHKGRPEMLDQILVTRALLDPDHLLSVGDVKTVAALPAWPSMTDDPNQRRNKPGSDHAAVIAKLTF